MKCVKPNCTREAIEKYKDHWYCHHCRQKKQKKDKKLAWKTNKRNWKHNQRTTERRIHALREKATWAEKIFKQKMEDACPVQWKFQRAFVKGGKNFIASLNSRGYGRFNFFTKLSRDLS